jgi:multidrug efflux pump subunit AcrA (membrane-fusion protein)
VILALVAVIVINKSKKNIQKIQTVATVESGRIVVTLRQTGVIKPQVGAMISVGARATGTLEMLKVKVGDTVTKGELIAQIDSRAITQNIKQSRDNLSKAEVELKRTQRLFPVQKSMQENSIAAARSNFAFAQDVYNREQVLYEKGYSRKETLDRTRHEATAAQTEYERQKLQLELMQAEYDAAVMTIRAEISRQRSILEELEIQLSYTKIYSPIDGVVSAVKSVQGETIVAGLEVANLITVFQPELLEMFVYVDESDVGKVNVGMPVRYTVDTYPGREFTGSISRINLQSETRDGVIYYVAIVGVSPADALLFRPEMTTSVRILAQEKDVPLSLPSAAIKWEGGSQIVYKVLDQAKNKTLKIPVKVGLRGETNVEILEGLEAGDVVVVRFSQ